MRVVLPAPFGPEVAEGAAPGDEQLDPVDGDVVPEPLGQPVGLDGPLASVVDGPRATGGVMREVPSVMLRNVPSAVGRHLASLVGARGDRVRAARPGPSRRCLARQDSRQ